MAVSRLCSVPDCGKLAKTRGWCDGHYYRWRRYGHPAHGRTQNGALKKYIRAVALVHVGDACLIWPYAVDADGYGKLYDNGRHVGSHRYLCEIAHGKPASPQLEAAHSCGNASCCNPRHLRWATPSENRADKDLHGTDQRGERHGMARLTKPDVLQIHRLRGTMTQREIAQRYGVSKSTVAMIHTGRNWRSLAPQA